jgi:hypothetical protein
MANAISKELNNYLFENQPLEKVEPNYLGGSLSLCFAMREQQHEVMGGGLRGLAPVENKNFAPLLEKVDNEIDDYIHEIDTLRNNYISLLENQPLEKVEPNMYLGGPFGSGLPLPLLCDEGAAEGPVENKNFAPLLEKVDNDILDYWLMLSNDERETEWNNYTDEEKEELNEKHEQLLFMLYWDS